MNADDALPLIRPRGAEAPRTVVIMVDEQGVVTGWSTGAEQLLGRSTEDTVGRPADDILAPDAGPPFWTRRAEGDDWLGELTARRADGRPLPLRGTAHRCVEGGARAQWILVAAEAPAAGQRLLPQEIERAVVHWLFTRSPVAVTIYDSDLRCRWQNEAMTRLTGVTEAERRGKRLPEILSGPDAAVWERRLRRVVETGESAFSGEMHGRVPADPECDCVFIASASALRDHHGHTLGLCTTVADVTQQYRSRERLTLLKEAGTRIGSTLDLMRTAQELADSAIPRLADWVTVDLLDTLLSGDEPGPFTGVVALRRAANQSVLEGTPEAVRQSGEVDFYPPYSPAVRCMATGRSAIHHVTDHDIKVWLAHDPARAEKFRIYEFQSIMGVPIRARGTTLGITMFYRRSKHPFTDDDRLLAEELVARAAVCLDNARRFDRERTAALSLQQSLLPQGNPVQAAVETASRYLPAGGKTGLAGDWFDVIPLSGARVALVVGDVVGHGINAAATMGRLRTAVRTLADVDLPPDELLTHLDDVVLRLAAEGEGTASPTDPAVLGATCTYAVYDPISRTCSIARAGHPPPVTVTPGGGARLLDLPAGPPLGLGGLPFESAEVQLPEDSLLALYTDGLLGFRERELDSALDQLCQVLAEPAPSLEMLCDRVLTGLLPDHPADDAALLIARTRALNRDQFAVRDLPSDPATVSAARSWAAHQLAAWSLEDASFVTELVVSELVTNAIRHAEGPIQLRLIRDRTLICEVSDASNTAPHMRRARLSDEGGRGLLLVAQLTQRWGTRHAREGKTIWCEQSLSNGSGPAEAMAWVP
ncbi:SpoIIE family protein phosphatase [Streptomyces sp. NA02950]|uniref:SpoIIE family protein phosphatase n=1 Tax=Streptomyces sp. NA02950 TaxID=2742137 RepID=UPI0015914627|nr:SpoIIE family protein phosphatase [Streptomyces sp. NA02950]QKV91843.1 SpoIIE family protein phosphatase [Streptomyces sp. NA02950]